MGAFCTFCGQQLDTGARFCTGCGRPPAPTAAPPVDRPAAPPPVTAAPVAAPVGGQPRPRWLLPTALVAAVAVIAGAVAVLQRGDGGVPGIDDPATTGDVPIATTATVDAPDELGAVTVSMQDTLDAPAPDATTFGNAVHVTAGGQESLRSDGEITIEFDLGTVPTDPDLVRVGYWDGSRWWMLRPDSVEGSTATLTTFHLSWLWPTKLTPEQEEALMLERAVNAELARTQFSSNVDEVSEQYIGAMLQELDIKDGEVRARLVEALKQGPGYRDLQRQFAKGDLAAFMPALQKAAGAAFGGYLEENSAFLIHPEGIGNKPAGLATKLGDAYGSFEAGDYDAAGRALSAALTDVLPKPTVFAIWEAGAVAMRTTIDLWKHDEIDAAYEAWRDGADGIFFGYNVDPGEFDALWTQMRGIATRLQSEAVTRFERAAAEAGIEVTDEQRDAVRDQVRAGLLEEFERRKANEERKAELQEELQELLEHYEDNNLFALARYGLEDGVTREQRFQQLLDIKARILADLGRDEMTMGPNTTDERVSVWDVTKLTRTLLSGGEDAYKEMLAEEFGIGAAAVDPSGTWSGSLVLTSVQAPEDSCLADAKTPGDPIAMTLQIVAPEPGGGSVTVTLDGQRYAPPLSWDGTTLSFTLTAQGGSMTFTGAPTLTEDGAGRVSGRFTGALEDARIGGTWTATRSP